MQEIINNRNCHFCKKPLLKDNVFIHGESEVLVCSDCNLSRMLGALKIIVSILEELREQEILNKDLLSKLDKLLIAEPDNYDNIDTELLIETLKQDFFKILFELNEYFFGRF